MTDIQEKFESVCQAVEDFEQEKHVDQVRAESRIPSYQLNLNDVDLGRQYILVEFCQDAVDSERVNDRFLDELEEIAGSEWDYDFSEGRSTTVEITRRKELESDEEIDIVREF